MATLIAVYANWEFARIHGCGWGWAGVVWLFSVVTYFPLDLLKFAIRYILSGKAWDNLLENKVYFMIYHLGDETYTHSMLIVQIRQVSLTLFHLFSLSINRPRLLQRKTMEKRREKHSGLPHRGLYMVFNHRKAPISSVTRAVTGNCQRLQNKPREGLRLQGKHQIYTRMFLVLVMNIIQRKHACSET